jgi:predicted metal-binding membrane protein
MLRLLLFAAGYLLVWAGAGALAFALMRPIEIGLQAGVFSARSVAARLPPRSTPRFTPPPRAARFRSSRSPSTVLGVVTAGPAVLRDLRAGAVHGAWCLACCWSLMAVLALVGLMNVAAMVLLAIFIFIEKTTRFGVSAGRLAGALMLAGAFASAVGAINL